MCSQKGLAPRVSGTFWCSLDMLEASEPARGDKQTRCGVVVSLQLTQPCSRTDMPLG